MLERLNMNKKKLLADLIKNYRLKNKKSEEVFKKTAQHLITGGSHSLRLFSPFPFYDVQCSGSKVWDADGNIYVDFWQGHFANVLGHNPKVIIKSLQDYFHRNQGLATGFPGRYQRELAELILKQLATDKIRFTTSGTLATMYAIMLSKAFTKRELVMKVGGGWHGSQPYALRGITLYDRGMNHLESAGLPSGTDAMIIVTRFNDIQDLENKFKEYGERTACFIIEPFIGAGGFIFSHKDYLQRARELTRQYGTLLIFDEVVSGFRFHAGGVQSLYNIQPDLTVLGKAIGGGMPVSAVAGRDDVLALCGPDAKPDEKVKFEGGTFCAHPAAMLAGLTHLKYLINHETEVYPRIGQLGAKVRKGIEEIFAAHGFNVRCTGYGDSIAENSSLIGVQFLKEEIDKISFPEQVWDPDVCDLELREKIFKLSMLEEGFNIFHGYGSISAAHTNDEIQASLDAVERIAKKWRKYT
jgi:glutamate-1-semialdehyde 2,1-aminomutase